MLSTMPLGMVLYSLYWQLGVNTQIPTQKIGYSEPESLVCTTEFHVLLRDETNDSTVVCAFECLRLANLYVLPSVSDRCLRDVFSTDKMILKIVQCHADRVDLSIQVEVVQCITMVLLTLANDCNPGVANDLLGIVAQQAQSLGLHMQVKQKSPTDGSPRDEVHPLWLVH